jgi:hypothetical protein
MLTQLLLAARAEGIPPFPYVRHMVRSGLPTAAARLHTINPELATQLLDVAYKEVNFSDRFLLFACGNINRPDTAAVDRNRHPFTLRFRLYRTRCNDLENPDHSVPSLARTGLTGAVPTNTAYLGITD